MICFPWIIPPLDGVPWILVCHREKRGRKKKTDDWFSLFFLSPLLTYEVKTTTKSTKHGVCVCVLDKPWSSACPGPCTHPAGAALGARPPARPGPSSSSSSISSTCSPGAAWRPRARSRGARAPGARGRGLSERARPRGPLAGARRPPPRPRSRGSPGAVSSASAKPLDSEASSFHRNGAPRAERRALAALSKA